MHLPLSFAALFLSVILLQLSSGAVGPLDAISGGTLGFSAGEIGALGSAHFLGFFLGCWWAPRLMGAVGYSRAFAAMTALGAMGLLAHMLFPQPQLWALFRIATGLCIAGCYTVIEAWLQAEVTNAQRGRVMGGYRVTDMGASIVAQLLISVLPPAAYASYTILAILCCAALLPLTLSTARAPQTPVTARLEPGLAWRISPLAVAGVLVAALSSASFRMVGPLYGTGVGLSTDQIALVLAAFVAGGAAAQLPIGWLADRFDRRHVLIATSAAAIAISTATAALTGLPPWGIFVMIALFGLTTFPIYSVAAAHAHDFATSDQRVTLSAALLFWYATGAIAAPYAAAQMMDAFGPYAMFYMIAVGHLALVIFGVVRMKARPTSQTRTSYVYAPRTSFLIGRLMSRFRERD